MLILGNWNFLRVGEHYISFHVANITYLFSFEWI